MTYLETLLQSAQTEAKLLQNKIISLEEEVRTLRETLDHKVKTAADYRFPVEYVKPKPLETKELEVRLQRLAAHLTKRAKENYKRAEKLDFEVKNTFMCHGESEKKDNSAYYHSGKADTYLRAAGKVLELLGPAAPLKGQWIVPENWIVEVEHSTGEWDRSMNCYGVYDTKEEAEQDIVDHGSKVIKYRIVKETQC